MSSTAPAPFLLRAQAALRRTVLARPLVVGASLFLLALLARLVLVLSSRFSGDEMLTFGIAERIAKGEEFPLLGPIITNGPARVPGPLIYDLAALPLFLVKAPEASNAFIALLGAVSVVVYWQALRIHFGEWGALLGSFMMACAPWSTLYADRVWNPNAIGIFVALAFLAACRLRQRPTLGMVILLVFAMAAMPQLHMSAPMVWLALAPIFLPSMRKWRWYWPLIAIAVGLLLYVPYVKSELHSHWANTKAFLHEGGGDGGSLDYKRVPLWAFRLMTLDLSYHQLHSYWGPHTEDQMIDFIKRGNSDFQFNFVRHALLALSFVFALFVLGLAAVRGLRRDFWKSSHPFFWAAAVGLAANTALLAFAHKEVFGHYVQALIPFYFVAFAAAGQWAENNRYSAWIWAVAILVSIGGIDSAIWTSETMDGRNGLLTMRRVIEAIEKDRPEATHVALGFAFRNGSRSGLEGYNVIAALDPKRKLRFDYSGQYQYAVTFRGDPQPKDAPVILETPPILLYRVK